MPNYRRTSSYIASHVWIWRAAALVWCGVIFWGSSLQGSQVPGRFGPLGHFGEYAILAALAVAGTRPGPGTRRVLIALVFAGAFALSDEYHQSFVPTRMPDPVDWLVDVAGATAGALGYLWVTSRWRRSEHTQ